MPYIKENKQYYRDGHMQCIASPEVYLARQLLSH